MFKPTCFSYQGLFQLCYSHSLKGDDGRFKLVYYDKEQGESGRIYPLLHGFG